MKENVFKNLRYLFTDEEKLGLSLELAKVNQEMESIEEEKKEAMADYRNRLLTKQGRCSVLAQKVTTGFEFRNIECEVEYHVPKRNQKTFVRKDTGEMFIDLMTDEDMTLFNQYERQHKDDVPVVKEFDFGTP